jgi:peptidoglycan/xylan/chitin deacetylase (PgdA/CDA1 family)
MICLMYHEIESVNRKPSSTDPGYLRYVISDSDFRSQMELLKGRKFSIQSVGKSLGLSGAESKRTISISFDDGCETDLTIAAPILNEFGFLATFYVVAGFVGKSGYLTPSQLRELSGLGFEIGCHSMTHSFLSDLDEKGLQFEIHDAKQRLEDIVGRTVEHYSCPGGRYDKRVPKFAIEAGFKSVATSYIGENDSATDAYRLLRVALLRDTPLSTFESYVVGSGLTKLRLKSMPLELAKRLLGNKTYDRLRSSAFGAE